MSEIDEKEIIRHFEAISEFKVSKDVTARDLERVRQRLTEQSSTHRTRQQNIWRMVIQSKITRLAAAAIIVIAAVIALQRYTGPVGFTAPAFGKVLQNMQQQEWIYFFTEDRQQGTIEHQYWVSPGLQKIMAKGETGWAILYDCPNKLGYEYHPSDNEITISYLEDSFPRVFRSVVSKDVPVMDRIIEQYQKEDAYIAKRGATYNGRDAIIYKCEVLMPRHGREIVEKSTWVVDAITHLPIIYEVVSTGSARWAFDYPDTAPKDIYGLGAPGSAQVIEKLPTEELAKLLADYSAHRQRLGRYGVILVENAQPSGIICKAGERLRVEWLDGISHVRWQEYLRDHQAEMGDTFESAYACIQSSGVLQPAHIQLYDGIFTYQTYYGDIEDNKPAGRRRSVRLSNRFEYLAWPGLPLDASIIQNEYSRDNGLICVESKNYRTYINPERDYVCERREKLSGQELKQVLEYGRTKSQNWYPKKIRTWAWGDSGEGTPSVVTVILDTNSELLDPLLDPRSLPNYVEWQRSTAAAKPDSDPNEVLEYEGFTPLHMAAFTGNVAAARRLLAQGAEVNPQYDAGSTPMELAATGGNLEMVQLLHQYGADILGDSEKRQCPLAVAARQGHLEVAQYLLNNGADINGGHKRENTALHYAAIRGDCKLIRLLLDNGADVNAKNADGAAALFEAIRGSINMSMTWKPQYDLQDKRYVEAAGILIRAGADINAKDRSGRTPLLYLARTLESAYYPNVAMYRLLIDSGADVNVKAGRLGLNTPLLHAVKGKKLEIAEILLESGADPLWTVAGDGAWTPMELAEQMKAPEMAELLRKYELPKRAETNKAIRSSVEEFVQAIKNNDRQALENITADHPEHEKGIWHRWADQIRTDYKGHYELLDNIVGMKSVRGWASVLLATPEGSREKHIFLLLMQFTDGKWRVLEYGESGKDPDEVGEYAIYAIRNLAGYRRTVFEAAGKTTD